MYWWVFITILAIQFPVFVATSEMEDNAKTMSYSLYGILLVCCIVLALIFVR